MSQQAAAVEPDEGTVNKWALLATATFVTTLYAISVTIASIALPDMRGALSATQDQITWTITGNIVATAVATPLAGWLMGQMSARRLLTYSVIGFIITTIFCGTAQSLEALVAARIGQGIFGASMVPVSQALVLAAFSARQRGLAMAIWGMGVVMGPILAPTLGGFLTEQLSWRWIFFMIVPIGFVGLVAVQLFVPKQAPKTSSRLDWLGFLSLAIGIAALQIMVDRGERAGWFTSPEIIIEACLAFAGFYFFFAHSLTSRAPFIDLRIMMDRNFAVGMVLVFCFGMLNFVPMVLFPPLLQEIRGYPQSVIGMLMGTRGMGTFLGFFLMAFAGRIDQRIPLLFGFALQAAAGLAMAEFDVNVRTWDVAWTSTMQGLGVGLAWVPVSVIAFSSLPPEKLGEATAVYQLARNVGSSVFISLSVAVLLHTSKVSYGEAVELVSPWNEAFRFAVAQGAWNTDSLAGLAALSNETQRQSLMIGYLNAFRLFTWTAVLAMPLVFLIRPNKTP